MAPASSTREALRRLAAAIDRLEGAVDRRLDGEGRAAGLEGDLHRLGTDRSRLVQSLDAAEARSARLEDANHEVSRRLVGAMESIRDVLERRSG